MKAKPMPAETTGPFWDLSHRMHHGMQVFPGDPDVRIGPALTVPEDGVAVSHLDIGSHSGTHLDAPSHSIVGGRTVDKIPLDWLIGPAIIVRIEAEADQEISAEVLLSGLPQRLPARVALASGWCQYFGSETYLHHPFLNPATAQQLVARGMRVLTIDWLNPDPTLSMDPDDILPVHQVILGGDGVIVENLRGLVELHEHVLGERSGGPSPAYSFIELFTVPLRIDGCDGSPVRAYARTRQQPS